MLKNVLILNQYAWKYSNTRPKCPTQSALWLGVKLHGLGLSQYTLIFISCLKFYDLGLFHIGPKDIGLTTFARHLS
jgi:hypothetical protein